MILNLIIIFNYIFFSNEEIINNGVYYIEFNKIYFRYLRDKIYLSEDFQYPFTSFRIEKQLHTFKKTYYMIGQISTGYQFGLVENNKLIFQTKKNNFQLWKFIRTKDNKYLIQNINGCYLIVTGLKIICGLKEEYQPTEFEVIKIFFETDKNVKFDDLKILRNEPIDVLIKYIDLYDPNLNRTGIHQIDKDYDNEELRYSLRSILKNIPWVRKIFILMPNEKVRYLKDYNLIKDKIVYVKDKDILGYDSSNDRAFQFRYWKLKEFGLSNNFIVMDDDYFIGNKLRKNDFFFVKNEKILPVIPTDIFIKIDRETIKKNCEFYKEKAEYSKEEQNYDIFSYSKFLTLSFILSIFNASVGQTFFIPKFTHNALPLNLQEIKEVYDIIYNSSYKYTTLDAPSRHIKGIQFQIFMLSYIFLKYDRNINNIPCNFIELEKSISANYNFSLFCINKGAGKYTSINYNNAKVVMEYLFPLPTPYEIINYSFVNITFNLTYSLNMELFKSETIRTHMIMKSKCFQFSLLIIIFFIVLFFKYYIQKLFFKIEN